MYDNGVRRLMFRLHETLRRGSRYHYSPSSAGLSGSHAFDNASRASCRLRQTSIILCSLHYQSTDSPRGLVGLLGRCPKLIELPGSRGIEYKYKPL